MRRRPPAYMVAALALMLLGVSSFASIGAGEPDDSEARESEVEQT